MEKKLNETGQLIMFFLTVVAIIGSGFIIYNYEPLSTAHGSCAGLAIIMIIITITLVINGLSYGIMRLFSALWTVVPSEPQYDISDMD